jgi:hypothetical protein
MKKLILIVGLTAALSSPACAATNLVVNGGFTSPSVGGYGQFSSIPGWTSGNGDSLEIGANGTYGLSTIGSGYNLEVNSNTWGDVSQTVAGLTVGDSYTLSYLYGGRPGGGAQALDVSFSGVLLTTDTGSIASWALHSFTVVATSTSEVLEFKSLVTSGNASYGNEITSVSVTGVPEVSTWAMMLAGFAGLGFFGYRRQKRPLAA